MSAIITATDAQRSPEVVTTVGRRPPGTCPARAVPTMRGGLATICAVAESTRPRTAARKEPTPHGRGARRREPGRARRSPSSSSAWPGCCSRSATPGSSRTSSGTTTRTWSSASRSWASGRAASSSSSPSACARPATERIIAICSIFGAISIVVGYLIISRIPVDTLSIWDYGTGASFKNLAIVAVICFAIFASFIALGIIVSTILGRAPGRRSAASTSPTSSAPGLGCLAAIPLITRLGPPDVIMVSALIFAVVGLLALPRRVRPARWAWARRRRRARPGRHRRRLAARRHGRGHEGRRRARPRSPTGARCSGSTSRSCPGRCPRCCSARRHVRLRDEQVRRQRRGPHPLRHGPAGAAVQGRSGRHRGRSSSSAPRPGTRSSPRCTSSAKKIEGVELNPVTLVAADRPLQEVHAATSSTSPASASTRPTGARTSPAATRTTTSSGTSRRTATPRTTRRRPARSSSPRATCTRRR